PAIIRAFEFLAVSAAILSNGWPRRWVNSATSVSLRKKGKFHGEKTTSNGCFGGPKYSNLPPATRPDPDRARPSSRCDFPADPEIRERCESRRREPAHADRRSARRAARDPVRRQPDRRSGGPRSVRAHAPR